MLRQSGFDVAAIAEISPGLPDSEVLAIASAELSSAWAGHFCVVSDRKIRITHCRLAYAAEGILALWRQFSREKTSELQGGSEGPS